MSSRYEEELLNNYEAFHLMIRSAAMLATRNSKRFDRDAAALADFIGASYGWRQELTDNAIDLICGAMMRVGLVSDYQAMACVEMLDDDEVKENLTFYELKGAVLEEVGRSESFSGGQPIDRAAYEIKSSAGFLAFHHAYEPVVRYAQISARAEYGELFSTLQTALMRILGIGCEKNITHAQRLLERALLWGEKSCCKILSHLWQREGDNAMVSFFESVYAYLSASRDLPWPLEEGAEDAEATEYCILIAAIQSLVRRRNEIDVAFADLINRDDIPFSQKITWIAKYRDGLWLRGYQTTSREPLKIGFLA